MQPQFSPQRTFWTANKVMERVHAATERHQSPVLRTHWSARLYAFLPGDRPSESKHTGLIPHTEEAPLTLKTSEYLAKLQSHHYKCHLSQLQRRADMPIKQMITLFLPPREHTAITGEQEQAACFWQLWVMLKRTIQLNWVTTLVTEITVESRESETTSAVSVLR